MLSRNYRLTNKRIYFAPCSLADSLKDLPSLQTLTLFVLDQPGDLDDLDEEQVFRSLDQHACLKEVHLGMQYCSLQHLRDVLATRVVKCFCVREPPDDFQVKTLSRSV